MATLSAIRYNPIIRDFFRQLVSDLVSSEHPISHFCPVEFRGDFE